MAVSPFNLPSVNIPALNPVQQGPGFGQYLASAGQMILDAVKTSEDNKLRQQQINQQGQQIDQQGRQIDQQALYASIQSRIQALAESESSRDRAAAVQLGTAIQTYFGMPPQAPGMPSAMAQAPMSTPDRGNRLQSGMGPAGFAPAPPSPQGLPEFGNQLQAGPGALAQAGLIPPPKKGDVGLQQYLAGQGMAPQQAPQYPPDLAAMQYAGMAPQQPGQMAPSGMPMDQYMPMAPMGAPQGPVGGVPPELALLQQRIASFTTDPYAQQVLLQQALQGVAPENIPGAVAALKEAQGLITVPTAPKAVDPTTDMQNLGTILRLNNIDPDNPASWTPQQLQFAQKTAMQLMGPKPTTQVNVNSGENAFDKPYQEQQAKAISEAEDRSRQAYQAMPSIVEYYGMIGKSFTGFGAKEKLKLSRIATAMGVAPEDIKEAAGDTQVLMKLSGDQVLAYLRTRALGSGTAVSDQDRVFMERMSGMDITQEPKALRKTARINLGSGVMTMDETIAQLREQAEYASPKTRAQILKRASSIESRLKQTWGQYGRMLQDEGETPEQILDRMSLGFQEKYGRQIIAGLMNRVAELRGQASQIQGLNMPGR
jgi:hypothetical protein